MTTLTPHRARLLVEPEAASETSEGGVFIPATAREKVNRGTVVAVGSEVPDLAVGDRIVYSMYAGTAFEVDGRALLLMHPDDAVAKFVA